MADPPPSPPLLDLYKIAIDEYRFEVKLGWDRTMYSLVFNSAIISVGTGLMKIDSSPVTYAFITAIFALGFFTSLISFTAARKSHEYYRRTIVKKALLEDMLGLTRAVEGYPLRHTLAVGTTAGQAEHLRALYGTNNWISRRPRYGSMLSFFRALFVLLAVIDLAGMGTSGWLALHSSVKSPTPTQQHVVPI